jgi:hypothetical protein
MKTLRPASIVGWNLQFMNAGIIVGPVDNYVRAHHMFSRILIFLFLSSPIACVACERTELLRTEITDPKMVMIFLIGKFSMLLWYLCISTYGMGIRDRPRFFDQVGHQTMNAYSGNKHFFTKSCHCQTYQNYEQPPKRFKLSYFQSHFSASKINRIFLNFFLYRILD